MSPTNGRPLGARMRPRDTDEPHRVSTPLELLFDLTFVFAASQVASALAHAVAEGNPWQALPRFLMVFFAIWWAWMQFTWFASGFDTDDALYRVVTLVQMAGVLVLAAGVPEAFTRSDFTTITVGYVIMRLAMVSQWLRAGRHPSLRATATRYAVGVSVMQLGWVLQLLLPDGAGLVAFPLLVLAELAVPVWAESRGGTRWHPHHVAERYSLFAIIALGECMRASAAAADAGVHEGGWHATVVLAFAASLLLSFGLWWIYFLQPAGEGLENRRDRGFIWGYGHYGVFAALIALGGTLEVAAEAATGHVEASDLTVTLNVAIPVAVFMVVLWGLYASLGVGHRGHAVQAVGGALAALLAGALPAVGVPLTGALVVLSLVPAALIAEAVISGRGQPAG